MSGPKTREFERAVEAKAAEMRARGDSRPGLHGRAVKAVIAEEPELYGDMMREANAGRRGADPDGVIARAPTR